MNTLDTCEEQVRAVTDWFDQLAGTHHRLPAAHPGGAANHDLIEQQA